MIANIPPIIIDTREQMPYSFKHPYEFRALETGDYTISGLENVVAVERKRHNELIQCLTWGRDRFKRELERSKKLKLFFIVVEASDKAVHEGLYDDWPNATHKNSISGTIRSWTVQFRSVHWCFKNDRETANKYVEELLIGLWKDFVGGKFLDEEIKKTA